MSVNQYKGNGKMDLSAPSKRQGLVSSSLTHCPPYHQCFSLLFIYLVLNVLFLLCNRKQILFFPLPSHYRITRLLICIVLWASCAASTIRPAELFPPSSFSTNVIEPLVHCIEKVFVTSKC